MENAPHFVARAAELAFLESALQSMLQGQGQVRLVAGKAGAGKSTLVEEFARRAQENHPNLALAVGICDPQTGSQDPYLPFREILLKLMAAAEPLNQPAGTDQTLSRRMKSVALFSMEAVLAVGPDLAGMVLPGGKFLAQVGRLAVEKAGWLDKFQERVGRQEVRGDLKNASGLTRDQVFEQYINVLKKIASKIPLVLVLDDLHWADEASLDLLFRLCRRLEDSRILLIGTYRPDELGGAASGERHPLEKLINELKRYFGDTLLDLDGVTAQRGRLFVDALLDSDANILGEDFRLALYSHTNGHPLFTVELIRDLRENGGLIKNQAGDWEVGSGLEWSRIPARVEGVIEERLGRLPAPIREELAAASVEGEQFTAEVLAAILSRDLRQLIRELSGDLQRIHQLVESAGLTHVGGQRLSNYRFSHSLIRTYLYENLDTIEMAYLHEEIARVLEEMYGQYAASYAVKLAHHYEMAQVSDKAATYLLEAGRQSAAQFAHQTALEFLVRAEGLLAANRLSDRYDLLETRVQVYDMLGERASQQVALQALLKIAEKLDDPLRLAAAELLQAQYAFDTGNMEQAVNLCQNILERTEVLRSDDPQVVHLHVNTLTLIGQALRLRGNVHEARRQLEQAVSLAEQADFPQGLVQALNHLSMTYWSEGEPANAEPYLEQALQVARELDDPRREWSVLSNLGVIARDEGRSDNAILDYQRALEIARQIGDRLGESTALTNLGEIYFKIGDYSLARQHLTAAQVLAVEIGDRSGAGIAIANLSECSRMLGDLHAAGDFARQALALFQETGFRMGEGIILGNLAAMAQSGGRPDLQKKFAEQSLAVALETSDRYGEGTALNLMAQAMLNLGEHTEAQLLFARAGDLWQSLGDEAGGFQAQLGLATCSQKQNNPAAGKRISELACQLVEQPNTLENLPLGAYLDLYTAIHSMENAEPWQAGCPTAADIANLTRQVLNTRTHRISDPTDRQNFIQKVALNRRVLELPG